MQLQKFLKKLNSTSKSGRVCPRYMLPVYCKKGFHLENDTFRSDFRPCSSYSILGHVLQSFNKNVIKNLKNKC